MRKLHEEKTFPEKYKYNLKAFCVCLSILSFLAFLVSLYSLLYSLEDENQDEKEDLDKKIEDWNTESGTKFAHLNISVRADRSSDWIPLELSQTNDWTIRSDELAPYDGIHFFTNSTVFPESYEYDRLSIDSNQYKLQGKLNFTVEDGKVNKSFEVDNITVFQKKEMHLNELICKEYEIGCWDDQCYYHYAIQQLCIVIDEDTLEPANWVNEGCSGSLEMLQPLTWTNCNTEPDAKQIQFNIEVRSINDPYVFSVRNNYNIIAAHGEWAAVISGIAAVFFLVLIFVPFVMLHRMKNKLTALNDRSRINQLSMDSIIA